MFNIISVGILPKNVLIVKFAMIMANYFRQQIWRYTAKYVAKLVAFCRFWRFNPPYLYGELSRKLLEASRTFSPNFINRELSSDHRFSYLPAILQWSSAKSLCVETWVTVIRHCIHCSEHNSSQRKFEMNVISLEQIWF